MLVTKGFHFDHPNGSILVPQGAPVCMQAAVVVTPGFHFDHPTRFILVTRGVPFCIQAAVLVTRVPF